MSKRDEHASSLDDLVNGTHLSMPLEFASFSFSSLYLSFALSYIKTSFFSIEGKNRTSYFSFILVEAAVKRSIQRDFLVKNIPLRVNREFDWTVLSAKRMVCSVFRDKIDFFFARQFYLSFSSLNPKHEGMDF